MCWGHHSSKSTDNKILREDFYFHSIFSNVYREVAAYHECKIFDGKRKLLPIPLKPISIEKPFQQWGLDFTKKLIRVIFVNTNGSWLP